MDWNKIYKKVEEEAGQKVIIDPYNCTYDYMGGLEPVTVTQYYIKTKSGKRIGELVEEIPLEGKVNVYWQFYK